MRKAHTKGDFIALHRTALPCTALCHRPPGLARGLFIVHWPLSRAEMEGIHSWPGGRPEGRCGVVKGTGWGWGVGPEEAAGVEVSLLVCRLEHKMVVSATTPRATANTPREMPPIIRDLVELNWRSREVWRMTLLEWAASNWLFSCGDGGEGVVVVAPGVLATEYTSPPMAEHIMMAVVVRKAFLCCLQHEMT